MCPLAACEPGSPPAHASFPCLASALKPDPLASELDPAFNFWPGVQVNGKMRGSIHVPAQADKAEIELVALASEAFITQVAGAHPKRVIVVPGRLVNIVV